MKLIVAKNISQKNGRTYHALILDMGFARKFLSFDENLCMQIMNLRISDFAELPIGEYIILEKGEK